MMDSNNARQMIGAVVPTIQYSPGNSGLVGVPWIVIALLVEVAQLRADLEEVRQRLKGAGAL